MESDVPHLPKVAPPHLTWVWDRRLGQRPAPLEIPDITMTTPRAAASHRVSAAAWIARNPIKRRAHHAVRNALRRGEMERQPCEVCGGPAEAHHPDYAAPLSVVWLCPRHHAEAHRKALAQPPTERTDHASEVP